MDLDLDAARAARAETRGETPTVTIGGETFTLPPELPMRYIWANDDMDALKALFDGQLDRFLSVVELTTEDIRALIAGMPSLYGVGSGESLASAGSSGNGSNRSRPTSGGSTASTSGRRAGARKR
jgi:hypothetical protein